MEIGAYPLTNVIPTSLSFPSNPGLVNYPKTSFSSHVASAIATADQSESSTSRFSQYLDNKSQVLPSQLQSFSQYPLPHWQSDVFPSCSTQASTSKTLRNSQNQQQPSQQQHPYQQHKYFPTQCSSSSYPLPFQFSPPTGPPVPNLSGLQNPGNLQWPGQNLFLGQQQQQQQQNQPEGPVERPWYLWAIGIVDIGSAAWYTILVTYSILIKPISDPETYIWKFFLGFLAILARFMQGLGLLVGLKSDDVISTLWYCKFWVACQFLFIIYSVISGAMLYINYPKQSQELPFAVFTITGVFIYRVGSFTLVRKFVAKVKKSESITLRNNIGSGKTCSCAEQRQDEEDSRNAIGESSFCAPSVALILSL